MLHIKLKAFDAITLLICLIPLASANFPGCEDTPLSFIVDGEVRDCAWAAAEDTRLRCKKGTYRSVSKLCPVTCGECPRFACKNPKDSFILADGIEKNCGWARRDPLLRCDVDGVASACRSTCNPVCKLPLAKFVGNPCGDASGELGCDICTGDCDNDSDCKDGLICFERSIGDSTIPGCRFDRTYETVLNAGTDFCVTPPMKYEIEYARECTSDNPCGECQGDCDGNDQCEGDKVCFSRDGSEPVPGCSGEGGVWDKSAKDICIQPQLTAEYVGNPCGDSFDGSECDICTGDCDSDNDCAGDLRCAQRSNSGSNIPGCVFSSADDAASAADFCFMPTTETSIVNYVGECGTENYLCGECEGDCDSNKDCKGNLICHQRQDGGEVPGCNGAGGGRDIIGKDICVDPDPQPFYIDFVGNPCTPDGECGMCVGDCDADSDCAGSLRCAQRSVGGEDVPGCAWKEGDEAEKADNNDFCFAPTSQPGVVNYVGECSAGNGYLCGECEGDCDGDDACEEGLACMSREGFEKVPGCTGENSARDMFAKDMCYKPEPMEYIDSLRVNNDGSRCSGSCSSDADCNSGLKCFQRTGLEYVPGCVTGGIGDVPDTNYCYTMPPNGVPTYIPGMLTVAQNGLSLSTGLSSRIIARKGQPVSYFNGGQSSALFHSAPDGAGVFVDNSGSNDGGWAYASNAEINDGGVGAITFNSDGEVINYEMVIQGTSRNCGGGRTYWGTWVTCEETSNGQIYEVDPIAGISTQQQTVMGNSGGKYEAFAYDNRDMDLPTFYATNDSSTGSTIRFTPDPTAVANANTSGDYSSVLTTDGTIEWLVLDPKDRSEWATEGTFSWTSVRSEADDNASLFYRNAEGIDIRNGALYMTTKVSKSLFILDLDNLTYTRSTTVSGAFEGQPDQVASIIATDPERDMLYFCEEGSGVNNGIHARDSDGFFYTIINGPGLNSETTGLAFSPDQTRMYISYQGDGIIFEITRDDGYPFGAHRLDIKYHA